MESWILTPSAALLMVLASALGIYLSLMVLTRLMGLRSFAKISSFDFAVTVAVGSLVASTIISEDPPLLQAVLHGDPDGPEVDPDVLQGGIGMEAR